MTSLWTTEPMAVSRLQFNLPNPRLGPGAVTQSPADLVRFLFRHYDVMKLAKRIAQRGYYPNEPLLAVQEDGQMVVAEGKGRLAALKALSKPELLPDKEKAQIKRLLAQVEDPDQFQRVPSTKAPSRRTTGKIGWRPPGPRSPTDG